MGLPSIGIASFGYEMLGFVTAGGTRGPRAMEIAS